MATYSGTKLVGVALELKKRIKNSPLCSHILHKTLLIKPTVVVAITVVIT